MAKHFLLRKGNLQDHIDEFSPAEVSGPW